MKKVLLYIAVMLMAVSNINAQRVDNPLILEVGGENKYEFSGNYSTPVYKYTTDKDELLSVTVNGETSIVVTYDGSAISSRKVPSVKVGNEYIFMVAKDTPVFLNVTTYESPLTLAVTSKEYPYNLGKNADEAIDIVPDTEMLFIPFREENYEEVPVYLKYTATEDGALEMLFSGYVHNAYFAEGNGEFVGITCRNTGTGYRTFIPVQQGKDYTVRISSISAAMLEASLIHPELGKNTNYPFIITGAEAEVPAAAGTYYYDITGRESGYAIVSSEITDFDGTVSWGRSVEAGMVSVADGSFDLRQPSSLGSHYYIMVEKNSNTAAAQKFSVNFEPRQPYDSHYTSANIEFNKEIPLPPYPGEYFYRITTPAEGANKLIVAPTTPFSDSESSVILYRANDSGTAMYYGEPDIYCEVKASTEYVLKVTIAEADKRNGFKAEMEGLRKGDGASDPIEVEYGSNILETGDAKYYLYQAQKNSWVVVTPADISINAPTVSRLMQGQEENDKNITILRHGDGYRFEAEAGRSYIMRFTKVKEKTSFEFSTPDYQEGESIYTPFAIEGDSFSVPMTPGVYWWSYTPDRAGKLQISTDFGFDVVSSPTIENSVALFSDNGADMLAWLTVDYTDEIFYPATYNVEGGKTYFIRVVSVSEQEDKVVVLELKDLEPGVTAENAIAIEYDTNPFAYHFPVLGARTEGKWYSIELQQGTLSISSPISLSFYFYKEGDTDNYLFYSEYLGGRYTDELDELGQPVWESSFGVQDKEITAPGHYLMYAYYWSTPEIDVTFHGSALLVEENGVQNVTVNEDADAPVYNLQGIRVTNPTKGFFIVNGKKIFKK